MTAGREESAEAIARPFKLITSFKYTQCTESTDNKLRFLSGLVSAHTTHNSIYWTQTGNLISWGIKKWLKTCIYLFFIKGYDGYCKWQRGKWLAPAWVMKGFI